MTKKESIILTNSLLKLFHTKDSARYLVDFNLRPNQFNLENYLEFCKQDILPDYEFDKSINNNESIN